MSTVTMPYRRQQAMDAVLDEVEDERHRQQAKWGEQNHPDINAQLDERPNGAAGFYGVPTERFAKQVCDLRHRNGEGTWADILVEEVAEVIDAAAMNGELREELIQTAAVCVAWVEAIDRREASK